MRITKEIGITLIALVITIVVMLILAGVAINLTVGDNGIFKRTEEATQIYQNAANNEATELNTAAGEMEKLILGIALDIQYTATYDSITVQVNGVNATGYIFSIKKADEENYTAMPEQTESTYTFTGLEMTLYKIKIEIKTESVTVEREIEVSTEDIIKPELAKIIFSATEIYVGKTITATVTQTDGQSGVNIGECRWVYNTTATEIGTNESLYTGGTFNSTTEGISLTETIVGRYYLHVLTVDNVGNKRETISEVVNVIEPPPGAPDENGIFTENSTINGEESSASNPEIPKGFKPVNVGGATWGSDTGYQKGLVIEDSKGNQFVWVPVIGMSYSYSRYNFGFKDFNNYSDEFATGESDSVNAYGGYYIGRYETGTRCSS